MRDADIVGLVARCWKCGVTEIEGVPTANIASYLIFAPLAHPLWSWHVLSVVHLRETPELGPPRHVAFPGATHEVLVLALDPRKDAQLDPDDPMTWKFLVPPDVVHQVILEDDDAAATLADQVARAVASGDLIPDSDWRSLWVAALDLTAEHSRLGGHPG